MSPRPSAPSQALRADTGRLTCHSPEANSIGEAKNTTTAANMKTIAETNTTRLCGSVADEIAEQVDLFVLQRTDERHQHFTCVFGVPQGPGHLRSRSDGP